MNKHEALKQYFGYDSFRRGQEELIDEILNGRDALGIMPTGAGKSLCYQVPALCMPGITIVVSPLISLMQDQVRSLIDAGVPAAYINSSLTYNQMRKALEFARRGKYKIIYAAPERLDTAEFTAFAKDADISMLTVDEAHCISQWGQDFRPSYLKICDFLGCLNKRPVISAFTATATREVSNDICEILKLKNPFRITTGFNRENLYFEVRHPADKYAELKRYLFSKKGESGIVYCLTRKNVETVSDRLIKDGIQATRYHAGLDESERTKNQEDFLYDRCSVMVATNAFGMGIDKSNVNFVVHYNMPKNLESYYQEAGRAGRDGTPAECILLYAPGDVRTNQMLIDAGDKDTQLSPAQRAEVREKELERLKQMTFYCHTTNCLRGSILRYFGDSSIDFCDNCGNCKGSFEETDVLEDCKTILHCIYSLRRSYGAVLICSILHGSANARIKSMGFDKLDSYGKLSELSTAKIHERINFMLMHGYITASDDEYRVIYPSQSAKSLISRTEPLIMKSIAPPQKKTEKKAADAPLSNTLFALLKKKRTELAAKNKVPAYIIFTDAALADMCRRMPADKEEMLEVSGVGKVKYDKYGEIFLEIIRQYAAEKS
ncbi:MAG: DNA helicase RecQ [Clostridia bacterium]|nr:DNA helicase RecQ [Clostridia bacterium]